MKVNITYPHIEKKVSRRQNVIAAIRWIFLAVAYLCALINVLVGGTPWSVIVLWALWTIWSFIIWPDLVEYNRISLWIRMVTSTAMLLNILAVLFVPTIAKMGVPLVWYVGVIIVGILFFTDLERQKQNMLPMLLLIAICLIQFVQGLIIESLTWELIAMGTVSFTLLVACLAVMRNGFVQEVKKRFHTR